MEEKNKIALIVPSYNDWHFLARFTDSLFQSITGVPFQIIIVDDHSTDGTVAWVTSNLENYVTYIRPESKSYFTRAVNHGISYALQNTESDYFLIVNSDITFTDYWGAGMVGTSIQKEAGIVGATLLNPNGTLQHVGAFGRGRHIDINKIQTRFFDGYEPAWVTGAAMMVKREVFLEIGLFPVLVGEPVQYDASDREFCKNATLAGINIAVSPAVLYHHTLQAESYRRAMGQYSSFAMSRADR